MILVTKIRSEMRQVQLESTWAGFIKFNTSLVRVHARFSSCVRFHEIQNTHTHEKENMLIRTSEVILPNKHCVRILPYRFLVRPSSVTELGEGSEVCFVFCLFFFLFFFVFVFGQSLICDVIKINRHNWTMLAPNDGSIYTMSVLPTSTRLKHVWIL